MKISERYLDRKFDIILINAVKVFLEEHIDAALKSDDINYKAFGTPKQVKLKILVQLSGRIGVVLDDIDKTFIFLEKDRKLITRHYSKLEYQEEYYNYHLENYYIRLVSLLDILGRLGNELYSLGLKNEKVSAHTFKERAKKYGHNKISEITAELITKINDFRVARHTKLHTGESDFKIFKNIVIWEDLMKNIGSDVEPLLREYTDKDIKQQLSDLKDFTFEIIQLIESFMNEAALKLEEYVDYGE